MRPHADLTDTVLNNRINKLEREIATLNNKMREIEKENGAAASGQAKGSYKPHISPTAYSVKRNKQIEGISLELTKHQEELNGLLAERYHRDTIESSHTPLYGCKLNP